MYHEKRTLPRSEGNSLHFIKRDLVAAPVVEPGRSGGLVAGHVLGNLQLATILEIGGDASGPETVGADLGPEPSRFGPLLDHQMHVGLGQGSAAGQPAIAQGREQRGLRFAGEPGRGDPLL